MLVADVWVFDRFDNPVVTQVKRKIYDLTSHILDKFSFDSYSRVCHR